MEQKVAWKQVKDEKLSSEETDIPDSKKKKQRNTCSLQPHCFPKEQVSWSWKSISCFQPLFPNSQGTQVSDRVITKCDTNYGLSLKKKKRWDRRQIPAKHSSRFYSDKILDLTKLLEIFLRPSTDEQHKMNPMTS